MPLGWLSMPSSFSNFVSMPSVLDFSRAFLRMTAFSRSSAFGLLSRRWARRSRAPSNSLNSWASRCCRTRASSLPPLVVVNGAVVFQLVGGPLVCAGLGLHLGDADLVLGPDGHYQGQTQHEQRGHQTTSHERFLPQTGKPPQTMALHPIFTTNHP